MNLSMKCELCSEALEVIDAHRTEVELGWSVTCCGPCDTKLLQAIDEFRRARRRLILMLPTIGLPSTLTEKLAGAR